MTKTYHSLLLKHSTGRNLLYPIRIDHIIHTLPFLNYFFL